MCRLITEICWSLCWKQIKKDSGQFDVKKIYPIRSLIVETRITLLETEKNSTNFKISPIHSLIVRTSITFKKMVFLHIDLVGIHSLN